MKFMEKFWINFNAEIQNVIVYNSRYYWGTNPWNRRCEMLFQIGEAYFMYTSWGNYTGCGNSLKEITSEEYKEEASRLRQELPDGHADDGKTVYSLKEKVSDRFENGLCSSDCRLSSESPLKAAYDAAREEASRKQRAEERKKALERKAFARKCGKIARKLGVGFENALAFGGDETELKNFILSLADAREQIREMSSREKKVLYHELFECGRARKRTAMEELGIYIGSADPNRIRLNELEELFD